MWRTAATSVARCRISGRTQLSASTHRPPGAAALSDPGSERLILNQQPLSFNAPHLVSDGDDDIRPAKRRRLADRAGYHSGACERVYLTAILWDAARLFHGVMLTATQLHLVVSASCAYESNGPLRWVDLVSQATEQLRVVGRFDHTSRLEDTELMSSVTLQSFFGMHRIDAERLMPLVFSWMNSMNEMVRGTNNSEQLNNGTRALLAFATSHLGMSNFRMRAGPLSVPSQEAGFSRDGGASAAGTSVAIFPPPTHTFPDLGGA